MSSALDRPTVLTPIVQAAIVRRLRLGCFLRVACESAGLSYGTFASWRRRWSQDDPAARRFDRFFKLVEQASALGEIRALAVVLDGGPGWLSAAWFLSRRFPQRWGRRNRTPGARRPCKPLGEMTTEELDPHDRLVGDLQPCP